MYKIMLADDEGIVIDSLTFIIKKNFGQSCIIKSAKTGRGVIELAEEFRPDIAFMDIQMPGINGIDAMKEIKKNNKSIIFIVMSAYDKFTYAKEAINLGVLEYLTKPANASKIVETLEKSILIIDENRKKRSNDLIIKEKLETVIPIIESGLIYTILFQDEYSSDKNSFKELLGIKADYGFMLLIQYGDMNENGSLTNPVGVSVKAQASYNKFRELIKEFFNCVIGPIIVNQIVAFIPWDKAEMDYNQRTQTIETTRNLIRKLKAQMNMSFRAGIGSVKSLNELSTSYREATTCMRQNKETVVHVKDIRFICENAENYPIEEEKHLLHLIKTGDFIRVRVEANTYFDWLSQNCKAYKMDIKTKVFEFILQAESDAFSCGVTTYYSRYSDGSFEKITKCTDHNQLKLWFLEKISEVCQIVSMYKQTQSDSVISKAKSYILQHFSNDISLDDVSREVDISPYYFSKLFKEKTGENFIEYLTKIRIEKAKDLLNNKNLSIKEICLNVGYGDPNYFSRIFKKHVGATPTEYKEGVL
jgi:two-component system, response regulator YesN